MNAGFYHYRQIESMKIQRGDEGHYFDHVVIIEGELPRANLVPLFKDEYVWVNSDGRATMADDSDSYSDLMAFQREVHNNRVS